MRKQSNLHFAIPILSNNSNSICTNFNLSQVTRKSTSTKKYSYSHQKRGPSIF